MSRDSKSYFERSGVVKELTPSDFEEREPWKLKDKELSVVLFYAPWCPWCQKLKPIYLQYADKCDGANGVGLLRVYAFNCEKYAGHKNIIKEHAPGLIPSYPTILFYHNGEPLEVYKGEREVDKLITATMRIAKKLR